MTRRRYYTLLAVAVVTSWFAGFTLAVSTAPLAAGETTALCNLHRGGMVPSLDQNSAAMFEHATTHGLRIETDLRRARTGEAVIFHDARAQAVGRHDLTIEDSAWSTLRRLRYVAHGAPLARLSELVAIPDAAGIIEVKPNPGYTDLFWLRVQKQLAGRDFALYGIDRPMLAHIHEVAPDLRLYVKLAHGGAYLDPAPFAAYAEGVVAWPDRLTPEYVAEVRAAGLRIVAVRTASDTATAAGYDEVIVPTGHGCTQ